MGLWVHFIWQATNPQSILQIAGPREDRKLEELIRQFEVEGELTAALAWYLYVNGEPRPYNLEPVGIATKNTSKSGKAWIDRAEDHSSITRFPLSAFLSTCEGYVVRARMIIDEVLVIRDKFGPHWPKQNPVLWAEIEPAVKAMRRRLGTMSSKWGAANEFDEENVHEH